MTFHHALCLPSSYRILIISGVILSQKLEVLKAIVIIGITGQTVCVFLYLSHFPLKLAIGLSFCHFAKLIYSSPRIILNFTLHHFQ